MKLTYPVCIYPSVETVEPTTEEIEIFKAYNAGREEYLSGITLQKLENIEKMVIEEVEPDEWDLKMIEDAKKNNDGSAISLDDLLKKEGLTYKDCGNVESEVIGNT